MAYISPYQGRRNNGGGGGGNQTAMIIQLLTVAPALKQAMQTSAAVRDAVNALGTLPAAAAAGDIVPIVNQLKTAFVAQAGSDTTTWTALRQQLVLNLVLSGMGGGGNSNQALLMVLLLNGGL